MPRLPPKTLPDNLPAFEDDGAAADLPSLKIPALVLEATDGQQVDLSNLGGGRSIIYLYPLNTHAQQVLAWLEAHPASGSDVAGRSLEALR